MTDMFSPQKRSEIMSHIRSKDTEAEKIVFRYLRRNHIYFQKHYQKVRGKPDIALPRKKRAVFVDGDFWHGRDYERVVRSHPNGSFWQIKIAKNIARDKEIRNELREKGWALFFVWESDIKRKSSRDTTLESIKKFLTE